MMLSEMEKTPNLWKTYIYHSLWFGKIQKGKMLFSEFLSDNHLYFPSDLSFFVEVGRGTISTVSHSAETFEVG